MMGTAAQRTAPVPPTPAVEALVIDRVRRSGSSFYWAIRLMAPERRRAMYAIYAFCREVDDIVDEPGAVDDKNRRLQAWRQDIDAIGRGDAPQQPLATALVEPIARFGLPEADLLAVVEGCQMDADGRNVRPSLAELDLYCDRVAAAVGRLSVRIFGPLAPRSLEVADHQGRALQLTNILRDVWEDAQIGRLYLPDELLTAHGVAGCDPPLVIRHPEIGAVCRDLARMAADHYRMAREAMAECSRPVMKPAATMLEMYHAIFRRGEAAGWRPGPDPIRLGKTQKLWIALRHGLF